MNARRSPWLLAALAALFQAGLATLVALVPAAYGTVGEANMVDDVQVYHDYASRACAGAVPYRDFAVEYPALAVPFFVAPRLLTADFPTYRWLFAAEMLAANAVAVGLVAWRVGRQGGRARLAGRLGWYTLGFAAFCPLALCRFDLLAMTWTFGAALAWEAGRPILGGVLAGTGTLVKLVPGVVVAPALLRRSRGERRGLWGFAGTLGVGVVVWLAVGGSGVARSFGYHLERGVEIGSAYGGGLMAAALRLDAPLETVYRHKSLEIETPWSSTVARIALPAQALALLLVAWRARNAPADQFLRFAAAAVLAFVAFGKVLSPQYVLWLLPFVACLDGRMGVWSRGVFLLVCLLTTLLYPVAFHWLLGFRGWAVGLLGYRNVLLVGLWAYWTFGPIVAESRLGLDRS